MNSISFAQGDFTMQREAARGSIYDEVIACIARELEAGSVPWAQPWNAAVYAPGLPRNADTRRSLQLRAMRNTATIS
jgi:antirestriction protein ArdC